MKGRQCVKRAMASVLVTAVALLLPGGGATYAAETKLEVKSLKGIQAAGPLNTLEKRAVGDLQSAMKALYGVDLAILEGDGKAAGGPAIIFGKDAALALGRLTQAELDKAGPDGYVMKCDGEGIVLAGPEWWGAVYGVYGLLEKLGVRYLKEVGGPVLPTSKVGELAPFTVVDKPAFSYRNGRILSWRPAAVLAADPRKGLNPELFDPKKTGSNLWMDHSAGYLVPKLMYYDEHPEYYAMQKDGKRIAKDAFTDHGTPLCLSNPDVTGISIERALGWAKLEDEKRFFMVTYGDTGVWCQCPECLKLDPKPGAYATRELRWANAVAKAIGEQYPDKIVITFAYGGSDMPPPEARPEKNVWVMGSTGLGGVPFWDHAMAQGLDKDPNSEKIEGWLKIAPRQYFVCEYQDGVYNPAPVDTTAARLRAYAKLGIRGIYASYGRPKNFGALWWYVYSRLMWDPYQDAQKAADEYIDYHYGAGAEDIKAFFRLAHDRYEETLKSGAKLTSLWGYPEGLYTDEFAKESLSYLSAARQAAEPGAPRLASEIAREEQQFILDWMQYPTSKELDANAQATLKFQLDRLLSITGAEEKERTELVRMADRAAVSLESKLPGARAMVQSWVRAQGLIQPKGIKEPHGIYLPAEDFMYGFGPINYATHGVAKRATGVYVKGNSAGRSGAMESEFVLDAVPGDGAATLELQGQDCDHDVPAAEIRIEINGKEIFKGPVTVVKRNWSLQSFKVEGGILKKGRNVVKITNVSAPESVKHWYERWLLVAGVRIKLAE